jgi:hypothetical protein
MEAIDVYLKNPESQRSDITETIMGNYREFGKTVKQNWRYRKKDGYGASEIMTKSYHRFPGKQDLTHVINSSGSCRVSWYVVTSYPQPRKGDAKAT